MLVLNRGRITLLTTFVAIAAQFWVISQPLAQMQSVSIFIARHAEVDLSQLSQPIVPLTAAGRQRADLLVHTFRG